MIRERNRLDVELARLGLKGAAEPFPLWRSSELRESLAYESPPVGKPADPFDKYRIRGGLYSPKAKAHASQSLAGLVLTSTVIGKEERRLLGKIPSIGMVSSETTRFANGKLGEWVATYEDFADYLEEVLQAVGRLRDLISAGSPEMPVAT